MSVFTRDLGPDSVAEIDPSGQAGAMLELGAHLRDALVRVDQASLPPVDACAGVVVAGMGGSAVGARLAIGALGDRARRPIAVADGYELPGWVGEDVLVLCASYSGGTEETLACYAEARRRGAAMLAATTGGRLAELARRDGIPTIRLPTGYQPRAAIGYSLVCALEAAALGGAAPSVREEVEDASRHVDALAAEWGPGGPEHGAAKTLASRLRGTVPIITGAGPMAPVAYRWKCQFNENAKIPAFWSVLPEADHNEVCGWAAAAELGDFSAVFLEDRDDHPQVRRRSELTARLAATGAHTANAHPYRGPAGCSGCCRWSCSATWSRSTSRSWAASIRSRSRRSPSSRRR